MYVVGLTGGIASGKSTVANEFSRLGIELVDADQVARQLVEPGAAALKQIAGRFGRQILLADGSLDRKALRHRVFADEGHKAWLDALLHPLIREQMARQLAACRSPYALLVVPLLVETGFTDMTDRVLLVDVDESIQIARTMARDRVSREQAEQILAAQASRKQRLAAADDVLHNSGSLEQLHREVAQLHLRYLQLARQKR